MDMQVRPIEGHERLYTYSQSQQIGMQTGLIGHLRMDFGSDGNGFYSNWFDFRSDMNTDAFKQDLDAVINALREGTMDCGAILSSRSSMSQFGNSHPECGFDGSYTKEYGIRVNTKEYAYILRMNPSKGDYNLYCYCYKRDWLDRHLKQAEKGIRFITPEYKELFRVADGDKVRIVTSNGEQRDRTVRYIDEYHMELGSGLYDNLYHICEFAERMKTSGCREVIPLRESLPAQCYSMLLDTGKIVILKKGETGYYPADVPFTSKEEAREIVDFQNSKLGVTRAQEEAMKAGSMFGFAVPAADPKNYDDTGRPIRPHRPDRGDDR